MLNASLLRPIYGVIRPLLWSCTFVYSHISGSISDVKRCLIPGNRGFSFINMVSIALSTVGGALLLSSIFNFAMAPITILFSSAVFAFTLYGTLDYCRRKDDSPAEQSQEETREALGASEQEGVQISVTTPPTNSLNLKENFAYLSRQSTSTFSGLKSTLYGQAPALDSYRNLLVITALPILVTAASYLAISLFQTLIATFLAVPLGGILGLTLSCRLLRGSEDLPTEEQQQQVQEISAGRAC